MPLDLVGKLHRTVYVSQCPQESEEDLVRLFMNRCGAIEAWDITENRIIVVFQSLNSVSNALTFNGLSFVDLTKKIVVWKATDPPPAEATQQLAIAGDGGVATSGGSEDTAERLARQEARQQRRAAIQAMLGKEAGLLNLDDPANRNAKLCELSYRQLKALCTLTADALAKKEAELAQKEAYVATQQQLFASMKGTATGTNSSSSTGGGGDIEEQVCAPSSSSTPSPSANGLGSGTAAGASNRDAVVGRPSETTVAHLNSLPLPVQGENEASVRTDLKRPRVET